MMFTSTLANLQRTGIVRPGRRAGAREIAAAEAALGVRFPPAYVAFLKSCGFLEIGDRAVFGLGPRTRTARGNTHSVTFHTQYFRDAGFFPLRPELLVVWHESHADCECLDTGRVRRGECPVVHVGPGRSRRKAAEWQTASTFSEWLVAKAREQLKETVLLRTVEFRAPRRRG